MSYDSMAGFARAQRAYDNMEAPSGGCECLEQEIFVCEGCGEPQPMVGPFGLPDPTPCPDCLDGEAKWVRLTDEEALIESHPVCSEHTYCGGCGDCPDCGNIGDPDD